MVGWTTLKGSNGEAVDQDMELRPSIPWDSDLSPVMRHEGNRGRALQAIRDERGGASRRAGAWRGREARFINRQWVWDLPEVTRKGNPASRLF